MFNFEKYSLNTIVQWILNIFIFIFLFSTAYYFSWKGEAEVQQLVKVKTNNITNYIALTSSRAVWALEYETLEKIVQEILKDKDIFSVEFTDDKGRLLNKKQREINISKKTLINTSPIFAEDGSKIGEVKVSYGFSNSIKRGWSPLILLISIVLIMQIALNLIMRFLSIRVNKPISDTIEELDKSATILSNSSNILIMSSQNILDTTKDQAASLHETGASLTQLSEIVQENVINAEEASSLSRQIKMISVRGTEAMSYLTLAMNAIISSTDNLKNLVKIIKTIRDKTAIIDEIVLQTKLLSFNASIEAERAGEHGKGFVVVASEVGKLAHMSGKAAQEISAIVKESIISAEEITVENRKKVSDGEMLVNETNEILKLIEESADKSSKLSEQILISSKEQARGFVQINQAVNMIDKVVYENTNTSDIGLSTSQQIDLQAKKVIENIEFLSKLTMG